MTQTRAPAPEPLRLVQEFLNTNDIEGGQDEFETPAMLAAWLHGQGLVPPGTPVDRETHERTLAVREALRDLIEARDAGDDAPVAGAVLSEAAALAGLSPTFTSGGVTLSSEREDAMGAIGRILGRIPLAADGSWSRLKVCRSGTCRWAFYDGSRNRSGHWCTMALCGNRTKARAYRRRSAPASIGADA